MQFTYLYITMVPPIEWWEITRRNAANKFKLITEEEKKIILEELQKNKEPREKITSKFLPCPFPWHKAYTKIWESLTPDRQKEMKENIKISADGKIEMIKMKKKFSILTAEHDGKNIFKWEYTDKSGKIGTKGVTYLTGNAAEKECEKQGKKLLDDRLQVDQFINLFPGEDTNEKIFNFVKLSGLEKALYWDPINNKWGNLSSISYALLSRVSGDDCVFGVRWDDDSAIIVWGNQLFPSRFVAYEDIIPAA